MKITTTLATRTLQVQDAPPRPWWPLWFHRQAMLFLPIPIYLRMLHEVHQKQHSFLHSTLLDAGIAHLIVMHDRATEELFVALMTFAEGARSLAGLEALYLSCMASLQSRGKLTLYRMGARTWAQVRPNTKPLEGNLLPIWDRETSTLTFIPDRFVPDLHRYLVDRGFDTVTLPAAIRNPGVDMGSVFGGSLQSDIGIAADKCQDIATGVTKFGVAIIGGFVGFGIDRGTGGSGGTGFAAGAGLGFPVGDALANLIAGAICKGKGDSAGQTGAPAGGYGGDPQATGPVIGYTQAGFPIYGNGKEASPPPSDGRTLDDLLGPPDPPMSQDEIDDLLNSATPPSDGEGTPNPEGGGPGGPAGLPNPEGGGPSGPALFPRVGGVLLETAIPSLSRATLQGLIENISIPHSQQARVGVGNSLTFALHNASGLLNPPLRSAGAGSGE